MSFLGPIIAALVGGAGQSIENNANNRAAAGRQQQAVDIAQRMGSGPAAGWQGLQAPNASNQFGGSIGGGSFGGPSGGTFMQPQMAMGQGGAGGFPPQLMALLQMLAQRQAGQQGQQGNPFSMGTGNMGMRPMPGQGGGPGMMHPNPIIARPQQPQQPQPQPGGLNGWGRF